MALGGKRPGAGRPKGKESLEKEALRKVLQNFVAVHMAEILNGLLERARGCQAQKKDNQGKDIVYDLPPDPSASKVLLDHSMGKPPESLDLSNKDGSLRDATPEQVARLSKLNASLEGK